MVKAVCKVSFLGLHGFGHINVLLQNSAKSRTLQLTKVWELLSDPVSLRHAVSCGVHHAMSFPCAGRQFFAAGTARAEMASANDGMRTDA